MNTTTGFGPDARPRAIVLTFDNLGEASALERGTWSADTPLGEDASVTRALPRLLDTLDGCGLTATFFVEAINGELNPHALDEIAARGHEVGVHGWRHEPWAQLGPDEERELLDRATAAFAAIGLRPRGFRPPGGTLTGQTETLLRAAGYAWYSAAAVAAPAPESRDGLASVPFSWDLVDAYHLMERFGSLRRERGDATEPAAPARVAERLTAAVRTPAPGAEVQTVVLHPFLMLDDEWWAGARQLLELAVQLNRDGAAWVTFGADFAGWLRG